MSPLSIEEAKEAGRRGGLATAARTAARLAREVPIHPSFLGVFLYRQLPPGEARCVDCHHGEKTEHDEDGHCLVETCGHKARKDRVRHE